jgi:ribosomal protein S18 acetylase RimI-like enzyme
MAYKILPFAPSHAQAIALLHRESIRTGFLSRLGPGFLAELYRSIGRSPYSRIFVAVDQDLQKVAGFAACSLDTAAMYRHILLRRGLLFFFLLLPRVFSPENLRFICETLFYPQKGRKKAPVRNGNAGPQAELLSIAVADDSRGKGVGRDLLNALESYLRENGVTSYKTVTLSTDRDANAFYKKCGFSFGQEMAHHGNVLNEYVKEIRQP